ncbi:MAG: serine hydrolase domain-containing protein [Opitutales bacterium]
MPHTFRLTWTYIFWIFCIFGNAHAHESLSINAGLLERLKSKDALFWSPEDRKIGLGVLKHLKPTRTIYPGAPATLPRAIEDLSQRSYEHGGQAYTIQEHLESQQVAGALVLKRGQIIFEHYAAGYQRDTQWNGFSIAKSVLGLLIGIAVQDGQIDSVEDSITRYLPELSGSAYERVSLGDLMHMSSGVEWSEDYSDPESDVARLSEFTAETGILGLIEHMSQLESVANPGSVYNYNTGEIYLLGAAVSRATERPLSDFLSDTLWQSIGTQSEAQWMLNAPDGIETAGCCIAATLEDHAKLGQFVLNGGLDKHGNQVVENHWIRYLRQPSPNNDRYGALWFRDGDNAIFAAGIFGQLIYVDFAHETVVVLHSHWEEALSSEYIDRRNAFVRAICGWDETSVKDFF